MLVLMLVLLSVGVRNSWTEVFMAHMAAQKAFLEMNSVSPGGVQYSATYFSVPPTLALFFVSLLPIQPAFPKGAVRMKLGPVQAISNQQRDNIKRRHRIMNDRHDGVYKVGQYASVLGCIPIE